jgi:hypothetical protein
MIKLKQLINETSQLPNGKKIQMGRIFTGQGKAFMKEEDLDEETTDEGFGSEDTLNKKGIKEFEQWRKDNAEQLGYKLAGTSDMKVESVNEGKALKFTNIKDRTLEKHLKTVTKKVGAELEKISNGFMVRGDIRTLTSVVDYVFDKSIKKGVMKGGGMSQINLVNEFINEETVALSKSDVKKMEKLSDKIIKDSETLLKMFRQKHKVSTRDSVLYNTSKDWEQAIRALKMKFGGWFGFVYDSDYIK